jgi:hypothetical protein
LRVELQGLVFRVNGSNSAGWGWVMTLVACGNGFVRSVEGSGFSVYGLVFRFCGSVFTVYGLWPRVEG